MSISGGLEKSVERGASAGCDVIQIFSKNASGWKAKPLEDEDREKLITAQEDTGVKVVAVHDSYLINIAHPGKAEWEKSVGAFVDEIKRAKFLGIANLVFHPGSHLGSGESAGIAKVVQGLNHAFDTTGTEGVNILIENTAGQGNNLGFRFSHLRDIIAGIEPAFHDRIGICFDTCHLFASGYDIKSREEYEKTMILFDKQVGLEKIRLFHINDSKKDLGSRVDRHEHIGKGFLGIEPFRFILADSRINKTPMVLETPKGEDLAEDRMNLKTLRDIKQHKS